MKKEKYSRVDVTMAIGGAKGFGFDQPEVKFDEYVPAWFRLDAAVRYEDTPELETQAKDMIDKEIVMKLLSNALFLYFKSTSSEEECFEEKYQNYKKNIYNALYKDDKNF